MSMTRLHHVKYFGHINLILLFLNQCDFFYVTHFFTCKRIYNLVRSPLVVGPEGEAAVRKVEKLRIFVKITVPCVYDIYLLEQTTEDWLLLYIYIYIYTRIPDNMYRINTEGRGIYLKVEKVSKTSEIINSGMYLYKALEFIIPNN